MSIPTHTQIVTPATTDASHHRLRIAATACWKLFERCTQLSPSHLGRNYGKFKVWCGNLGVRRGGHASLDWRLKDDDTMKTEVFSMLTDLEDDLQQGKSSTSRMSLNILLTFVRFESLGITVRDKATLRARGTWERDVKLERFYAARRARSTSQCDRCNNYCAVPDVVSRP